MEISFSSAQNSIWLFQQKNPESSFFNIGGYASLNEPINVSVFFSSYKKLIETHIALRFKIKLFQNSFVQYVENIEKYNMEFIDFSNLEKPEEKSLEWIKSEMNKNFQIIDGVLHESVLLKCSETNFFWYLKLHHIISDGFSISILFNDLSFFYKKIVQEENCSVYPNRNNYISYIEEEKEYVQTKNYKDDKLFWVTKALPVPALLKFSDSNGVYSEFEAGREELVIKRSDVEKVVGFCVKNNISLFHYCIAVLYVFFYNLCLSEEFIIGIPVINRPSYLSKKSVGPYFNVLPFRMDYGADMNVLSMLKKIKTDMTSCIRHMHFPILDIIKALEFNRNLYNVTFSYQKIGYESFFNQNAAEIHFMKSNEQMNDLDIHILDFNDNTDFKIIFDYKKDKFSITEITDLIEKFKNIIISLLVDSNKKVFEIDIFSDEKRSSPNLFTEIAFKDI